MSCLLPLIAGACLLDPTHVEIRADAHWQVSRQNFYSFNDKPYDGAVGRVEILGGGYLTPTIRLYYGVGHESFIDTNQDRGFEYAVAGLQWRPFAR